uniref:Uncharacterized protein n=1 Tax=Meloidogyne enterolobii TaxID=390850 RepID=A0A6V7UKL6_MELEN|nr:unnamed protein product [Meloidogyne enterolobii]
MEEDLIQIDETEAIFSKEELEQAEKILDEEEEDTISLDGGVIIEIATETKLIPKEKQRFSTTQGGNFRVDVPTWLLGDDNIEILGEVVREKEYRALTSNYPLESVWWTTLPGRAKLNQLLTTVIFWCSMLSPNIYGVLDWLTRIPGLQVIWIGERPPPYHPITWVHPNADTNLKMLLGMLVGVGAKFELTKIRKRKRSSQNNIPQEKFPQVAVVPRLSGPSTSGSNSAVVPSNNSAVVPFNNKYPNHIYEVFADHQAVKNYPTVPNYNPLAGEIVFIPSKGEAIAFFTKRYILSNFWPSTFWLHEQQYFSVEQYYCEQKCLLLGRLEAAKEVMRTYSPAQAKNLAALRTHQEMVDWSRVKYGVMMEGLTAKFSLPQEKEILISTHPAMLLEASSDTDWGTGERLEQRMRVGRGDNNLGKLLMILRDTIIKGEQQVPMFEDSDRDFRSCASSPTPSVQTMNSAPWGSTVVSISQQPTVELGKENEQVVDPTVELVDGPEQKLEQKIWKLFEITMENCYDERFDFIEKLSSILEKEIGECRTFPFGSTLSRLAKVNTDIDVFVFTPEVNLVKEEKLKLIRNVLRKHFEFEKLVVIANAKCPVMVAKVKNGFSVDITVGGANDMKGIYNSLAINILGKIDERFRVMFCAVKTWARRINDPKKGTLNSFSLVLLIQSFLFQMNLIPNIFKRYPEIYKETKIHNFASSKLHHAIVVELRKENESESKEVVSLLTLFFEWFASINFSELVVNSRSGELVQRPKGEGAAFKNDLIVILEPFAQEANSARAVNMKGWKEIKEHLRRTVESARSRDWLEWQELMGIHEHTWPRCGPPRIKAINDSDSDDEVDKLGLESKTIIRQMKNFAATPTKEEKEAYDPERNWKLSKLEFNRTSSHPKRVFVNSKVYGIMILTVLTLIFRLTCASFSTPLICHNEGNSKFVRISKEKSTCLNLDKLFDEAPITLKLTLYRPDQKEYEQKARLCAVVMHVAKFWTNLLNDPFTETQQIHIRTSKEECEEMIRTNVCKHGNLVGDPNAMTTTNKLEIKHTYWSIGKSETSVTNCIVKTITVISQPGREEIMSPLIDLSHCRYSEGNCHIDDESVVVWKVEPTEGVNAFWHNSERRCVFKKFATRNGTLYRNGWLSYPPDLALTFPEDPKTITSCHRWLIVSDQGLAVEQRQYDQMHGLIKNRKRREKEIGILDGSVEVSQLESQMQARSLFADRELRRAFSTYSRMLCDYITDLTLSGEDFTHLNPTIVTRKLANIQEVEARWVEKNILEFWPCSTVHKYEIVKTEGICYDKLMINLSISESEHDIKAFLDPITFVLSRSANPVPCERYRLIAVELKGILSQVDQITGKITTVKEITELSTQTKEWSIKLPKTDLQIFRKLILTNLSHPQLEMLEIMKGFRMNEFNPYKMSKSFLGGGSVENRENSEPGIWGTLWPRIDPWTIIVRAVVLIVIGSWVIKGYTFFLTWRVKRTIKHCQIKENFNEFKQVRSEAAVHTQQPRRKSRKFNRRARAKQSQA